MPGSLHPLTACLDWFLYVTTHKTHKALVLLEASWDGEPRRPITITSDDDGEANRPSPEPWPPSRITAK